MDTQDDNDEPAFGWMTPKAAGGPAKPAAETVPAEPTPATGATPTTGATPAIPGTGAAQPGSRADRKAAEAADTTPEPPLFADASTAGVASDGKPDVFSEPLPTSALHIRPPEAEVARRNAEREQAANAKPAMPRVFQVLLAVFYPVILLVLAVRAVTSALFLWVEYNRPGFPGDGYGFNTEDRMTYGSYAMDYLSNWSGPRYLGDLVGQDGSKLFKGSEVAHMADVKLVMLSSFGAGALLILLSIIAMIYLRKRSKGGIRRGLFAGSIVTLVVIIGLGVLAVMGWQQFFTEFHRIFFANGSWTFALDDTLIRLFPGQFWMDAGIAIAVLVFVTATVTLVLTWPTRRRRGLPAKDTDAEEADADVDATQDNADSESARKEAADTHK